MHPITYSEAGLPPEIAENVLICIHGRGGTAEDILHLGKHIELPKAWLVAPEAENHTWYPYSFMAPVDQNQPSLDNALAEVHELVLSILKKGFRSEQIYFLGFSQGACLTLEYTARNAKLYGGIIAFTGGLIGEVLTPSNYKGNFLQTPILITSGDPDLHVPVSRIQESKVLLKELNANINIKIYPNKPHTIHPNEIQLANEFIFLK